MPTFDVFLARTYKVQIQASDAFMAERLVEEFIGAVQDISTETERAPKNFKFKKLK